VRLEGTLDAFSLPDIFQLLSYTKKTGTLHLRREGQHGVVHVRDGAVTGGRGDVSRQALGRRLVGAGLVDDETLAAAAEQVLDNPGLGLGKTLVETGKVDADAARDLAAEQASDAVFELLRWPNGEFAFVMDEQDPDEVGASLAVEDVVAEAHRRLSAWQALEDKVPSLDAVVTVVASPSAEPAFSRDEWALLALVNGERSVSDLVSLAGTGEFVVVAALADLAERGLVNVGEAVDSDPHAQRQQLLSALEGRVETPAARAEAPAPRTETPAAPADEVRPPVIPDRPEPFTPSRRPDHAEPTAPAFTRYAASVQTSTPSAPPAATVGAVQGAHALAAEAAPSSYIDRDPSVNKSLLLRLIAGVRGL
jgi:hypothetical protein